MYKIIHWRGINSLLFSFDANRWAHTCCTLGKKPPDRLTERPPHLDVRQAGAADSRPATEVEPRGEINGEDRDDRSRLESDCAESFAISQFTFRNRFNASKLIRKWKHFFLFGIRADSEWKKWSAGGTPRSVLSVMGPCGWRSSPVHYSFRCQSITGTLYTTRRLSGIAAQPVRCRLFRRRKPRKLSITSSFRKYRPISGCDSHKQP